MAASGFDDLAGRVALVSGGASGIGLATAERLAAEGATLVIADVDEDGGRRAATKVGGRFVRTDVTDPAAWRALVDDVVATEGGLDIAHLNAGVLTGEGDLRSLTDAQYRRITSVNIDGVVFGARAAGAAMVERGGGAIVATASMAGLIAFSMDPIYTMTKHAVVGLVRALGPPFAAHGVTVNAVCPGIVDTPLVGAGSKPLLEAAGLTLISAEQVADAVVTAVRSGLTGEAWVVRAGVENQRFTFPGVELAVG
ncbi:MAG TPA: SDR family NAD(P)-dependent oxidoreductase [Acidimicrobiales bacterium]|nr:SDR family NAD(P)-dependent oxidoreductase [Acidimicrobiales bacterium]